MAMFRPRDLSDAARNRKGGFANICACFAYITIWFPSMVPAIECKATRSRSDEWWSLSVFRREGTRSLLPQDKVKQTHIMVVPSSVRHVLCLGMTRSTLSTRPRSCQCENLPPTFTDCDLPPRTIHISLRGQNVLCFTVSRNESAPDSLANTSIQ